MRQANGGFKNRVNEGVKLATGQWRHLCEDLVKKDEYRGAMTALLLENTHRFYRSMQEDTKIANVGVWDKFAMPIIRAVFPNLIATDLVSVQPMDGPTSLVFFLEARYGKSKGSALAGQTAFSALDGKDGQYLYSSETIDEEVIGEGDGNDLTPTITPLSWKPIRPGSVILTATVGSATRTIRDNANGVLSGTNVSGTINYATGEIALTFVTTPPDNGTQITAQYDYNSEGNSELPQLDLMISHSPVQAHPHKLRARWSVEAATDLKAVQGLDAEAELMAFIAEQLRFEIDRGIIQDLFAVSNTGNLAAWDKTPPVGVPYYTHQLTFINSLIEASQVIFKRTRRATANWIVCGTNVASIIEALPNFKPVAISGAGVVHLGNLMGRWEVYKDPYLPDNEALLGYRGTSFADAGFVYAPYVPLYRTPTIYLDDMVGRVGLMSRYGKKLVNPNFFVKTSITST